MQREQSIRRRRTLLIGSLALAGGAGWLAFQATRVPPAPVYTRDGYGGYVSAPKPVAPSKQASEPRNEPSASPLQPALQAYDAGRYEEAEAQARQLVAPADEQSAVAVPAEEKARAQWVLAFSAARRRDLKLARQRFAELRETAAGERWTIEAKRGIEDTTPVVSERSASSEEPEVLPDRPVSPTGTPLPTLEEEAAYQHAVLTAALTSKPGTRTAEPGTRSSPEGERELVEFIRRYPESPLVHAAIRRIGKMHGGDVPKDAERVWQQAMKEAQERQHARDRERSLCGPEVLAEVLRRRGSADAGVRDLARELNTDHQGTTLKALAQAAEKRGFTTKGLRLTWDGLWKITNGTEAPKPGSTVLVALIQPGHFVLIEQVTAGWVSVWDSAPDKRHPSPRRQYSRGEWERAWSGVVLQLRAGRAASVRP